MEDASIAIIGAGPLGLELAIALTQSGIPYLHFEKDQIGQMIFNFPIQTQFFSSSERIGIAGFPIQTINQQKCSREAYLDYLRMLSLHFNLQVNTHEKVVEIEKTEKGFQIHTLSAKGKHTYHVRFVVMATGGTSHPRMLGVPGEEKSHVFIKMPEPHQFFRKKVLIIGGRNSAAEAALRCYHAGADVSLSVRSPQLSELSIKYWLLPELISRINKGEITGYLNTEVVEILSDSAVLRKVGESKTFQIPADFVIKAIGFSADLSLCEKLGVTFRDTRPEYNPDTMETKVPGVYLLGTIVGGTQDKYRVFIENTHVHVDRIMRDITTKLNVPNNYKAQPYLPDPHKLEE